MWTYLFPVCVAMSLIMSTVTATMPSSVPTSMWLVTVLLAICAACASGQGGSSRRDAHGAESFMMSKVVALVLFAGAAQAQTAIQDAAQFCAYYQSTCSAIGTNFANTAACETWYNAAPAGTLADPIGGTEAGGTRACYQYHLSVAPGAPATHCPHARGTTLCVNSTESAASTASASAVATTLAAVVGTLFL